MVSDFYPHLFWKADLADYNCSGKSYEEWKKTGEVSRILGIYFFTTGIITLICYMFVIYTMSSRFLLTKSCWKLMYFNCYIDCVSCIFTGILFYDGAVFCTWPTLTFAGGGIGLGCWSASCISCIAIAINRCSTICNKETGLFKGKRTYIWIIFALCVMIYSMIFTRPPIFNSKRGAWFYYPFILEYEKEAATIVNYLHPIINCSTAAIITILYSVLCGYLCVSGARTPKGKHKLKKIHQKIFIQSAIVCCSSCAATYIYVYMQFFPVPSWLIIWASVGYQLCSDGTSIIVIGGFDGSSRNTVWRMDVEEKNKGWRNLPPLNEGRYGSSAVRIKAEAILVVGGCLKANCEISSSAVEIFDGHKWDTVSPLPLPRGWPTSVVLTPAMIDAFRPHVSN